MASTNKTVTLGLSQFIATDKASWQTDYNSDMEKIDNFAAGVDGDVSQAVSDAENAKTIAQTANTAAQQAQTAATQAQSTATQAQSTATQAQNTANSVQTSFNQTVNGWKNVPITNPDATNTELLNAVCRYNKSLGLLYINARLTVKNNKTIGANTVLLNISKDIAGSTNEVVDGLCQLYTNQDKSVAVNGTIDTNGNILYGPYGEATTAILNIYMNACISMAGKGNGWVGTTT